MEDGYRKTLQIMLDRLDGSELKVADCQKASYQISSILDVNDSIDDRYNLEVSSPGVDRPLTRLKDFLEHIGFDIKLELKNKIDNRRRYKAVLKGCDEKAIEIQSLQGSSEEFNLKVDFDDIKSAKLILTDNLFEKYKEKLNKN